MGIQTVNQTWQLRAACRGPESTLFFPPSASERKEERETREARAKIICSTCPVREQSRRSCSDTRSRWSPAWKRSRNACVPSANLDVVICPAAGRPA